MTGVVLCRLADIADGGSNGFVATRPGGVMPLGMHSHDGRQRKMTGREKFAAGSSGLGASFMSPPAGGTAPGGNIHGAETAAKTG